MWKCEMLHRSAPQDSSIQNAVRALDLYDPFLSHSCHCRRERNAHLNSLVIVYMDENHIKPLHTPRYNHALSKITARLPGPILRWEEASALTRVVMPCSASLCPLDRCAVIHTFPVKPEPHHVLWAIFNAAVVTSARPIPQRLGQIWGMCGWVGGRRCLGIVGVIKLHLQADKDGSISVDIKSALFGLISLLNDFPRLRLSPFFPLALSHPLAPTQWNTSRRCQPSLKVRVPLGVLFRGTLPPPRLRGLLSLYPQRWKSPAASLWRCARCHGNSVLQTQKTGSRDVQTFLLFTSEHRDSGTAFHQNFWSDALTEGLINPALSPFSPPLCPPVRYFEVISATRKNSVFLRAKDPAMAQSWYNAIQNSIANLLPRMKDEMKVMQPGLEVKHVGWIAEQVRDCTFMVTPCCCLHCRFIQRLWSVLHKLSVPHLVLYNR